MNCTQLLIEPRRRVFAVGFVVDDVNEGEFEAQLQLARYCEDQGSLRMPRTLVGKQGPIPRDGL